MRKSVKRMLDRLRTATNGMFRKPTATRDGLQELQQMGTLPVPEQAQS
jgi:hypothetical protein